MLENILPNLPKLSYMHGILYNQVIVSRIRRILMDHSSTTTVTYESDIACFYFIYYGEYYILFFLKPEEIMDYKNWYNLIRKSKTNAPIFYYVQDFMRTSVEHRLLDDIYIMINVDAESFSYCCITSF